MSKDPAAVFVRNDWIALGLGALLPFIVYCLTLAPTVTLEQSGALVVAGEYLGVGRVPGYPVWHVCAWVFTHLFSFVRYYGQPNPAWATNLMSAVFGALSCGMVALIVSNVGRNLLPEKSGRVDLPVVAAVTASLLLGLSSTLWSQSVITETHTLTLFCFMSFHVVGLWWMKFPTVTRGVTLAAVVGVGIGQTHFLILLVPSLIQALGLVSWRVTRDFLLAVLGLVVLPCIYLRSSLPVEWRSVSVVLCIALATYIPRRLSHYWAQAPLSVLALAAGLGLYFVYLPLASEGNPPIQFGYARTWEGFWHVFTRGQYERITPVNVFAYPGVLRLIGHLNWYWLSLIHQFWVPFLICAAVGLFGGLTAPGARSYPARLCAVSLFVMSVLVLAGTNPKGDLQDAFIQRTRLIPSYAMVAVFIGIGLCHLLSWLTRDRSVPKETFR